MRMLVIGCSMDIRSSAGPLGSPCCTRQVALLAAPRSASDYAPAAYPADAAGDTSQWSSDSLPAPPAITPSAIAAQVR